MRLSTKVRYGLRALCHIAHRGHVSAQAIADHQAIPSRYLEEIIGELRKSGLVVGKRGPRGGYRLSRPPAEIMLAEILEALTTPSGDEDVGTAYANRQDELTRAVEQGVDNRLQQAVANVTLEQLLGEARESFRQNAANYVI